MKKHVVAVSLAAAFAGCATPNAGTIPKVPESLQVPATQALLLETHATGVQIYECKATKDDPERRLVVFEWVFKEPQADLFDVAGTKVGKHYAGPTWEWNDGSKVVGEVKARDDGPDADAIAWLLLSAKSSSGAGVLGRVASIQRVQTAGGKAPVTACAEEYAGKQVGVPYTAAYYFYVVKQ
jgi:Protein of unknown function (DUF3455)